MRKDIEGQLSLDLESDGKTIRMGDENSSITAAKKRSNPYDAELAVAKAQYLGTELMTHAELFNGFDTLHVVTYSYSLSFFEYLLTTYNFENAEFTFGYDGIVGIDVYDILALQAYVIEDITTRHKRLAAMVRGGKVRLRIMNNEMKTHEKLFLMKSSANNAVRVITGSANASKAGFDGSQGEIYTLYDAQPQAYYDYMQRYNVFRKLSSDTGDMATPIIDAEGNPNIEEVPAAKRILSGAIVVEFEPNDERTEYRILVDKKNKLREKIATLNLKPNKDGKIVIDAKVMKEIVAKSRKKQTEALQKRRVSNNPELLINYDNNSITLNGTARDLEPDIEAVKSDLLKVNELFAGFKTFIGDVPVTETYWKVWNYMFVSPFLSKLRAEAVYYGGNKSRFYPGLCLLRGVSDSGKTHTVQAFQQLMLGFRPVPLAAMECFTVNKFLALRMQQHGLPILIDEVLKKQFSSHGEGIAKSYETALAANEEHEPSFILCSNVLGPISRHITKRMVVFDLDAKCPQKQGFETEDRINALIASMTTALYDAYCAIIFSKMDTLISAARSQLSVTNESILSSDTDIFAVGSNAILQLYQQADVPVPDEFRALTWEDMVLTDTGKAERELLDKYRRHPETFRIDRRGNEMTVDFSAYKYTQGQSQFVTLFTDEAPENWQCKAGGGAEVIFRNLAAVEEDLGIKFTSPEDKRSIWHRLLHRN